MAYFDFVVDRRVKLLLTDPGFKYQFLHPLPLNLNDVGLYKVNDKKYE